MPPSTRRSFSIAEKPAAHHSTHKADADDIPHSLGKMSLKTSYNFEQQCAYLYLQKSFTKSKKDFAEVELIMLSPNVDHFMIASSPDGLRILLHAAMSK